MPSNRSMPASTVIPVLAYEDLGEAIDWLTRTFGFTERWRAGSHRAQLAVADGAVALTEQPASGALATVMVRIADVDAHHARTEQHGARILQAPADHPYGERQYTAEDLAGHRWTFSQTIADVVPEEWGGTTASPAERPASP
jgi:uncharacterized glyoxalase superfamily protein PhnB